MSETALDGAGQSPWNKLLCDSDLCFLIEDYFESGAAQEDMEAVHVDGEFDLDVSGLAICAECGATCTLGEVIVGHAWDMETPCYHSWLNYQHNGYPVFE